MARLQGKQPSAALRRLCQKYKVRIGSRGYYKTEAVLRRQCVAKKRPVRRAYGRRRVYRRRAAAPRVYTNCGVKLQTTCAKRPNCFWEGNKCWPRGFGMPGAVIPTAPALARRISPVRVAPAYSRVSPTLAQRLARLEPTGITPGKMFRLSKLKRPSAKKLSAAKKGKWYLSPTSKAWKHRAASPAKVAAAKKKWHVSPARIGVGLAPWEARRSKTLAQRLSLLGKSKVTPSQGIITERPLPAIPTGSGYGGRYHGRGYGGRYYPYY